MTDSCVKRCLAKPGDKLDSNDSTCLSKCADRFVETVSIVSGEIMPRNNQAEGKGKQ